MKNLVILGGGTGGTLMANKLSRALGAEWAITVVDRDDQHLYQPGLLFVPFGTYKPSELTRSRRRLLDARVVVKTGTIDRVNTEARRVLLVGGDSLAYDFLIIASGARILPEQTEGLTASGWRDTAHDFYTLDGATLLARKLESFTRGRLVLNVAEMPIKCPVAPLEFLFLADDYFTKRGVRKDVEIVYATPLDGAFTKPRASALLGGMLEQRNIKVIPDFAIEAVDGARRMLKAYDGRETGYDLLVSIPLHGGAEFTSRSGLGDAGGWVPTDKHTLRTKADERIFALGDATDLPASKAGAVAHFQGEVLIENVLRAIDGRDLLPAFDGHANCFIETGFGKAMLIDFNYDTEPLPGRYPLPGVGPFTLLEESAVNHWGKLAFRWVYWNALLQGKDLPVEARMSMAGKIAA